MNWNILVVDDSTDDVMQQYSAPSKDALSEKLDALTTLGTFERDGVRVEVERASDEEAEDGEQRVVPEPGARWFDPEGEDWGEKYVEVVEMPGDTAGEWPIVEADDPPFGKYRTVATENNCEKDEPVVVATYEEGSGDKQYAFPLCRLQPVCRNCGPLSEGEATVERLDGTPACSRCTATLDGATTLSE
jgi:hypothetical protein